MQSLSMWELYGVELKEPKFDFFRIICDNQPYNLSSHSHDFDLV